MLPPMKTAFLLLPATLALLATASAQMVVPGPPQRPGGREIGGTNTGTRINGNTVKPPTPTQRRTITHVVLTDTRIWRNTDGRTIEAKLIAFDDLVTETTPNNPTPPTPTPPNKPTVVKNGKARLLIGTKPYEILLTQLVKTDQDFIEGVRSAIARKPAQSP